MKSTNSLTALVLVTALGLTICSPAMAAAVSIVNPSFELNAPYPYSLGYVPLWNVDATGSALPGTAYAGFPALPQTTDGQVFAYVNPNGGSADIWQALTATFAANTQYTLSVDVIYRADYIDGPSTLQLLGGDLLASGALVASSTIGAGTPGNFVTQTVSFTTGSGDSILGKHVLVALSSSGSGSQADWDNVRLDATPVPEPETLALLLTGASALGIARMRRRNPA